MRLRLLQHPKLALPPLRRKLACVNVFAAQDLVDTFESPSTETNGNGDNNDSGENTLQNGRGEPVECAVRIPSGPSGHGATSLVLASFKWQKWVRGVPAK